MSMGSEAEKQGKLLRNNINNKKKVSSFVGIINKNCTFAVFKSRYYYCEYSIKTLLTVKRKIIMAYVIGNDCIACGTCIDECPVGAISEGDIYSINPDMCTECGTCADVCPSGAISLP